MNKNDCTDYFTELKSLSCSSTCCGTTGQFISDYPQITRIYGSTGFETSSAVSVKVNFSELVTVRGYNFNNTKHVFLSATNMSLLTTVGNVTPTVTSCNFYSHIKSISATFTEFSGCSVVDC
jgi:hypothetical protein